MQTYIPFYFDWADHLSRLSDAEYGRLIKSVLAFAMGAEDTNHRKLSPSASMAYKFITSTINRAEAKRVCREQGERTMPAPVRRGGKTFKRVERVEKYKAEEEVQSPTNPNNNPCNRSDANTNDDKNARIEGKSPTNTSAHNEIAQNAAQKNAPTREQVRNFFKYRGFKSNPDEFFNFYDSNGWKVGQNPMKNWNSSAENWELRANRERPAQSPVSSPPRHGDFDVHEAFRLALERSYSDTEEE